MRPKRFSKHITANRRIHRESGASLIEVIVAVFVFTIGVLSFAALQTKSLQATYDNSQRDQVVWISESLVSRIRANLVGGTTYTNTLTDFVTASCPTDPTDDDTCAQTSTSGSAITCTAVEMATFDIWDVLCSNDFQGTSAVRGLEVDLDCTDIDGVAGCDTDADYTLTTSWCARGIETNSDLASETGDDCANTIAQMQYQMEFRP